MATITFNPAQVTGDGAVPVEYSAGSITVTDLADDSVDTGEIIDGAVVNVDIGAAAAIAWSKMAAVADISTAGVVIASTGVFAAGGKISVALNGGAESAGGLFMGAGTSGTPATTAVAGSIFSEFRTQSTATSGDSRGLYMRHDINGAGGGGESLRSFSKVTAAASTVRGAHISLDLDAAGTVSGFGAGVDAQLMLGGAAYSDDITVMNLEVYANASASVTGRTSFLRPVIQGDGTAVADVNANAFFVDFSNVTASAAGLIDTDITALTGYGSLKVRCPDGVTRYIPITTGS